MARLAAQSRNLSSLARLWDKVSHYPEVLVLNWYIHMFYCPRGPCWVAQISDTIPP